MWLREEDGCVEALYFAGFNTERNFGYVGHRKAGDHSVPKKIDEKVTRWYEDNGYQLALVVDFRNLDSRELVCEVVEGDITHVVVQFQDELGNAVSEEKPQYGDVRKEIRKYVSVLS